MEVKKEQLIQKLKQYVKEIEENGYFGFHKPREIASYLIIFLHEFPNSKTFEKFRRLLEKEFGSWVEFERKASLYFADPSNNYKFVEFWIQKDNIPSFFEILNKHKYSLKTTKERLDDALKDLVNNRNNSNFSKIADCFVDFLYEHPDSKTMEDFVFFIETDAPEWLNKEVTWDPFFGVIDENKFISSWINENEINLFKEFLKEECRYNIE